MPELLLMLLLEHRNTAALLSCLDHQLRILASGQVPDRDLLNLTMNYFETFPEQCHHPKEELILAVLIERVPAAADTVGKLTEEHAELTRVTNELARCVRDANCEPRKLETALDGFLRFYRSHMKAEEEHFFPTAERVLSDSDWAALELAVSGEDDPLFDHSRDARFAELRQMIAVLDEAQPEAHTIRDTFDELARLTSLAGFNQAMEAEGRTLRLLSFADGGWGIGDQSGLLAHIPPCSETRAVWCAYFFARGIEASDH